MVKQSKRICRYLAGTPNDGIKFSPNLSEGLNFAVDADYAGLYNHEDQDLSASRVKNRFCLTLVCHYHLAGKLRDLPPVPSSRVCCLQRERAHLNAPSDLDKFAIEIGQV
jgi:hypothetical protein